MIHSRESPLVNGTVGTMKKRHRAESFSKEAASPSSKRLNVTVSSAKKPVPSAAAQTSPAKIRVKTVKLSAAAQDTAPVPRSSVKASIKVPVKPSGAGGATSMNRTHSEEEGTLPASFATGSNEPFVSLRLSERAREQLRESCEAVRGRVEGVKSVVPEEENYVRKRAGGEE